MVYGAINEKGETYYTNLRRVFDAIGDQQKDYNWLITNCECYPSNPKTEELLHQEYCWISGEELTELVSKEGFQWIWAVLSGFDKNVELSEVLKYDLPYADGNRGIWESPVALQHPLAHTEIITWDSTLTLLFSEKKGMVESFMKFFPYSEELNEKWFEETK